jgi:hypothetical protein
MVNGGNPAGAVIQSLSKIKARDKAATSYPAAQDVAILRR